jgi:hypothetical protein
MARTILFALRLVAIPVLLGLIFKIEARQPIAMFRLLTFGAAFLFLADIASLLRGSWRDFALALTSLAFGIFLIEAAANIWGPRDPVVLSPDGLFAPQPVIGWGPGHAGRFHAEKTDPTMGSTIYSVDYTIDSNLLRKTQSCETGPAVVFFGCSFTFGVGLNDDQTLPQAFADSLDRKVRVLNLGIGAYGPQHFLAELQSGNFDSVIGPHPRLFVFATAAWHVDRSACKPYWMRFAPRYKVENGQPVLKGACYEEFGRVKEWLHSSAAYRWLIDLHWAGASRDDVELYLQVILAATNLAKAKYGAAVIVLYLESNQKDKSYLRGTGFTTEAIIQRLRDGGATVIDASLDKEQAAGMVLSIPGDGHPTGLANRLRATILRNYLEQNTPEVLASSLN